jgi:hypothetical protein
MASQVPIWVVLLLGSWWTVGGAVQVGRLQGLAIYY